MSLLPSPQLGGADDCPKQSGILIPALVGALAAWAIPHVMSAVVASFQAQGEGDDVEIDIDA